jgi:hypothetical protein
MAAKVPEIVRQQRERQISHRRTRDHLSDDALKDEIARLTSDLKLLRRKLRAERYRTRRLVNLISDLERLKKQAKKPRPIFELGDYGEASAVLLAQQRFKSQNRAHWAIHPGEKLAFKAFAQWTENSRKSN